MEQLERDVPCHVLRSQSDSVLGDHRLSRTSMSGDEDRVSHLCEPQEEEERRVRSPPLLASERFLTRQLL